MQTRKVKSFTDNIASIIASNPRAWYNFNIKEIIESGLVLWGSEVKSLRQGGVSIKEAYVDLQHDQLHILNMHIPRWDHAAYGLTHKPKRPRKLLLHRHEHHKLLRFKERKGYALIALKLYFNNRGISKLDVGLAKGKTNADKREIQRERCWNKQKSQLLKRY